MMAAKGGINVICDSPRSHAGTPIQYPMQPFQKKVARCTSLRILAQNDDDKQVAMAVQGGIEVIRTAIYAGASVQSCDIQERGLLLTRVFQQQAQ